MTTLPPQPPGCNVPLKRGRAGRLVRALSNRSSRSRAQPMKKVWFKTPWMEFEAEGVPPWLACFAILAVLLLVLSGAWVWV